jgi:hypothetical protein
METDNIASTEQVNATVQDIAPVIANNGVAPITTNEQEKMDETQHVEETEEKTAIETADKTIVEAATVGAKANNEQDQPKVGIVPPSGEFVHDLQASSLHFEILNPTPLRYCFKVKKSFPF